MGDKVETLERERVDLKLAKFAVETRYFDIPRDLVVYLKHLVLKGVADMIAGASMPHSKKMAALMKKRRTSGDAGVIGFGFETSLWDAVFLNSFFAHAAELEDCAFTDANGRTSGPSWIITVLPVVLGVAQKLKLSGKDTILAFAVGLEVIRRTCLSNTQHMGLMQGPGAIGPAVAAAKALGLNIDEMRSAMGLAISAPYVAIVNYGTTAHFFESALQSKQGVMAAEMAKQGLTGNCDLQRYLSLLVGEDKERSKEMTVDLGSRWLAGDFWIKKFPCSFGAHKSLDLVIELRKKHNLSYEDVEAIETTSRLDRPNPKDAEEAQVSIQHTLGAAILDGDYNLGHLSDEALFGSRMREARAKVRTIPAADGSLLTGAPDRIVIRMKDGREFSGERAFPIGSYQDRMTEGQHRDLYRKFAAGVLSPAHIEKTADMILALDELNDIEELLDILTFRHRTPASRA